MIYSEKDVIEKIKNLTKNVKNDQTFESVVDRFINETFGDPSDTGDTEGVESLILDLTNNNEEIRKFFNNDQYNILIEKLNLWQDQYFE